LLGEDGYYITSHFEFPPTPTIVQISLSNYYRMMFLFGGRSDSELENKSFKPIMKNVPKELVNQALGLIKIPCASPISENDWLMCYIKDQEFNGAGDPAKLEEILNIFLNWIK
jgi:hypothetical protein